MDTMLALELWDPGVLSTAALISLLTLTLLEVVLGIDNVVFIAILSGKLPENQRAKARNIGLGLAAAMRILMLFGATWVLTLDRPEYTVVDLTGVFGGEAVVEADAAEAPDMAAAGTADHGGDAAGLVTEDADHGGKKDKGEHVPGLITWKDLIILIGGLFLLGKAVYEIHDKLEGHEHKPGAGKAAASFTAVILQVLLLDLVFSIDSVITAVGIAEYLLVMIVAVLIAVVVMITFAGPISSFVETHPTMKILALSFLILIGVLLVAEAFEQKIPKGYIYFSMAFALLVELMNIRLRSITGKGKSVDLHQSYVDSDSNSGYADVAAGGLKRPGLQAIVAAGDIPADERATDDGPR